MSNKAFASNSKAFQRGFDDTKSARFGPYSDGKECIASSNLGQEWFSVEVKVPSGRASTISDKVNDHNKEGSMGMFKQMYDANLPLSETYRGLARRVYGTLGKIVRVYDLLRKFPLSNDLASKVTRRRPCRLGPCFFWARSRPDFFSPSLSLLMFSLSAFIPEFTLGRILSTE